jgi:sugar/nucleoside kinase (ribokinase family)
MLQLSGIIVDLIYWVETLPKAGEEAIVDDFRIMPGGGFNAMIAAKRAGMEPVYGGSLGAGPLAELVQRRLEEEGISIHQPTRQEIDQGCSTVLVERSGERTFIAREGADGQMALGTLTGMPTETFAWTLLSGYALDYAGSREAYRSWMRGDGPQSPLVFDPSPVVAAIAPDILHLALSRASWISANRQEATFLTGETNPVRAAERLATGRKGGALVRKGAEGCVLATDECLYEVPGHPVSPIDTNGAGDTHIGSFLAVLADGASPLEAARYANVAAALSTTERGSATAPPRNEVERTMKSLTSVGT